MMVNFTFKGTDITDELFSTKQIKGIISACEKVLEQLTEPFIWNTLYIFDNKWFGINYDFYSEAQYILNNAIDKILEQETQLITMWDIAEKICDEDKEWEEEKNKNYRSQVYYKYTLKPEYAEKLRPIVEQWISDLKNVLPDFEVEEEKERIRKEQEQIEREKLKASLQCEILEQGRGEDKEDTIYAKVKMTDNVTGESLEFWCRNIFDFGYVINPNYEVVEGADGALATKDGWEIFEKGWRAAREMTEFEKKCVKYLSEFPPISSGIRM